ncbi:pyrroline-5-carboxylate reductase [Bacillus luteus]|uniref:Pyrroline-5-carboxylate reductase n=2 Tax=Alkalicoccus luteus TaxID=1237094 RepID=A0A969PQ50_9BACI|nr:pyrroline-5-carboxylate reductase [Alkalicoccus luteus]NJP36929.1 pyrroline-5-carboxylate reductase [Alkalicoccus luteus]
MGSSILFIGAGRMAEAVIAGIAADRESPFERITVANKSNQEKRDRLAAEYGVHATDDWLQVIQNHDVIVLAAPPSAHGDLLNAVAPLWKGQLIVTLAAGIDPEYMEARLPAEAPVCWIMPNTAAQIGESMTTFVCGNAVTSAHRPLIEGLLQAIGPAEELTAAQVHELTAVTGSAPAFMYYIASALQEAAAATGISEEQAQRLVVQMMKGSAAMLATGKEPKDLMQQVASPGGSTAEGLHVLETYHVDRIIKQAVEAVNRHAGGNT